ncbi:hypothetical protein B4902_06625 [Yersinia frederiksenii]|nr:hypothetical protein B4902_06625 [Yersinia frederiksenii]
MRLYMHLDGRGGRPVSVLAAWWLPNYRLAQFTLGNYTTSVRIFNDIAKANEHEKNRISNNGEIRAAAIKKDIAGDECAIRLVPSAAADLLRKHANQIRSGATGTDTSKLTF